MIAIFRMCCILSEQRILKPPIAQRTLSLESSRTLCHKSSKDQGRQKSRTRPRGEPPKYEFLVAPATRVSYRLIFTNALIACLFAWRCPAQGIRKSNADRSRRLKSLWEPYSPD